MHAATGANGDQDAIAVDGRGACGRLDGIHQGAADDNEGARDSVPRHVVAEYGHEGPVEHDCENEDAYKGQEPNGGSNCRIGVDELEIQGDVLLVERSVAVHKRLEMPNAKRLT